MIRPFGHGHRPVPRWRTARRTSGQKATPPAPTAMPIHRGLPNSPARQPARKCASGRTSGVCLAYLVVEVKIGKGTVVCQTRPRFITGPTGFWTTISRILQPGFGDSPVHSCEIARRTGDNDVCLAAVTAAFVGKAMVKLQPHALERSMLIDVARAPTRFGIVFRHRGTHGAGNNRDAAKAAVETVSRDYRPFDVRSWHPGRWTLR